jgi:hypothetical protein
MFVRGWFPFVLGFVLECGGTANGGNIDPPGDADATDGAIEAATDSGPTDAGAFACGDAMCDPSQICLYPAYGCIGMAPSEAGTCPAGTAYSDASSACVAQRPSPSCVSLASGQGSFDCSGSDAGPSCGVVSAPIPGYCSRVCRSNCS